MNPITTAKIIIMNSPTVALVCDANTFKGTNNKTDNVAMIITNFIFQVSTILSWILFFVYRIHIDNQIHRQSPTTC